MKHSRAKAFAILDTCKINPTGGRLDKLAALLEELGHADVRLELVPRGGLMRAHKETTRKIGQARKGKSAVEIWAVWEED